jgi:KaiC/GvpD/RAD55 family RecA-like ATPase
MVKAELIKQSPLRILDASTRGGLGKGNLGVLTARHGLGKMSAMVHLAVDRLLQGKGVIHITFASRVQHILDYYEEIFTEISKMKNLEKAFEVHEELVAHRMIMNFEQKSNVDHILDSVKARLGEKSFAVDTVIVDEFDFSLTKKEEIEEFQRFAKSIGAELWFSVSLKDEGKVSLQPVPQVLLPYEHLFSVMINLRAHREDGKVHLELIKDHATKPQDTHLVLDAKTLLILKD